MARLIESTHLTLGTDRFGEIWTDAQDRSYTLTLADLVQVATNS